MKKEHVRTRTTDRLGLLENGDAFIVESEFSRLLRIPKSSVRWEYVNAISDNTVGAIRWSRYIPNEEFDLEWMENQTCR